MIKGPILEGIVLSGLRMPDEWEFTGIRSVAQISVGGTLNIWEGPVSGWVFTVSGGQDTGVLPKSVLNQIFELSKVENATYTFDPGDGSTFPVRFAHNEPPVVSAERVGNIFLTADNTLFNNVTIKLMRL